MLWKNRALDFDSAEMGKACNHMTMEKVKMFLYRHTVADHRIYVFTTFEM